MQKSNNHGTVGRTTTVQLFIPNPYHGRTIDRSVSTIGGPSLLAPPPVCGQCQQPTVQLMHVVEPGWSFTIHACNSASCFERLFAGAGESDKEVFSVGGKGVVHCERILVDQQARQKKQNNSFIENSRKETINGGGNNSDDDDWATENVNMDDLETRLSSVQVLQAKKHTKQSPQASPQHGREANTTKRLPGELPWFKLSQVSEPPPARVGKDADDVGLSTDSNDHIQKMLQKYLEEEEDVALVDMLRNNTGDINDTEMVGEPDEVLSAADHAELTYMDRVKRLPRQVARYAPGGRPLWSVPEPELSIPSCSLCGKVRTFHWQVLPQILHVLRVDEHAAVATSKSNENESDNGTGMDFANLCFYVCTDCDRDNGIVVIQKAGLINSQQRDNSHQSPAVPAKEFCEENA